MVVMCLECDKRASYGMEGKPPMYCRNHAKPDMVNVRKTRCDVTGCDTRPTYGKEDGKPVTCKKHAKDGMIELTGKRCEIEDCDIRACCGTEQWRPIYCKTHAEVGMHNVVAQRCKQPSCDKQPSYGKEDKKPVYCKEHAEASMIYVLRKMCEDCDRLPSYGIENKKASHCRGHAKAGMIDVVNKRCKLCNDTIVTGKKYRGYCLVCFINTFPDESVTRNYKIKERYVTDHAKILFATHNKLTHLLLDPATTPVYDRVVKGGCSLKRGDIVVDCLTHVIIIEIDENQHKGTSCENKRVLALFQDMGNRPMVIIRFNPDGYLKGDHSKVPSCFTYSEKGICKLKHAKNWEARLEKLDEATIFHVNNIPTKELTTVKLYYDEQLI